MKKLKSLILNKHIRHWVGIISLLAVSVAGMNLHYETGLLLTSVLDTPPHAEFDGTVPAIQTSPDWTHLSGNEYYLSYSEMSQDQLETIPEYRNDYLTFPSSDLVWGNAEHDVIRNTKITYPVAYAGNYQLDDTGEYQGSHPAVDIKVPDGTPVHAIANGVVTKAGSSSGFGYYIVLKHVDVPDPDSPNTLTTLYSSYSHLSEFFVTQGEEVLKDAVIGEVGATGTATTNHLHFQLDNDNAPWHPYWPFTSAEASSAGYGFWDAVNYGVGKENVYAYTENPMEWVYDNLDWDASAVATEEVAVEEEVIEEVVAEEEVFEEVAEEVIVEEEEIVVEEEVVEEVETSVVTVDFENIEMDVPDFVLVGDNKIVNVTLIDANGDTLKNPKFDGKIEVSMSDSSVAKLNRNYLEAVDFNGGEAELQFYADHEGSVTLTFEIANRTYYSGEINLISDIAPFSKFGVASDGYFVPGVPETIQIQALDISGDPTPSFTRSGNVELSVIQGDAVLSETTLTKRDFPTGVAEIEMTTDSDDDIVIQVVFGDKVAESDTISYRLFSDLSNADDYYESVVYLYKKGTVQGYPDGSFQPERTVSRVEALKFIFSGLDKGLSSGTSINFRDTESGQWYSDYLATAYDNGVIQGYSDGTFKPSQGVNRVEFLKMLFAAVDEIVIDPVVTEDPYEDVSNLSWFAPYVQYAKENNIFPVDGSYFTPSEPMSRIEVAEVIYRLTVVLQNDEAYSVLLSAE